MLEVYDIRLRDFVQLTTYHVNGRYDVRWKLILYREDSRLSIIFAKSKKFNHFSIAARKELVPFQQFFGDIRPYGLSLKYGTWFAFKNIQIVFQSVCCFT